MDTRNMTDRIWLLVVGLLAVLMVAGAVRVIAAPVNETYGAAQEALNQAEYLEAIELYKQAYEEDQAGELAAKALYWRAFAHYKLGDQTHLKRALQVLEMQRTRFPESPHMAEAEDLYVRVTGSLARLGDARSVRRVREIAHTQRTQEHEYESRLAALNALMMMDSERALPILKKLLSDADTEAKLKRHALMVLTQVDDEEAEQILLEVVARETDPEMLAQSLFWLSQMHSDAALDAVLEAYRRTDSDEVKEAAIMAMSQTHDRRAGDLLIGVARDVSAGSEIRCQAVYALSQIHLEGTADIFMDLFKTSDDTQFKSMIMYAMTEVDHPASKTWFADIIKDPHESIEVRQQGLHNAGQLDLIDVDFLRDVYRSDNDPEMRTQVCYVLSQLDDPAAVDLAIDIVRSEDNPEVRHQAIYWLGQFEDPRIVDFLIELIEED